jgi:hypothetical protein
VIGIAGIRILPLRLDDTDIPAISDTIAYIDLRTTPISEAAHLIESKLKILQTGGQVRPAWEDSLVTYAQRLSKQANELPGVPLYVPVRYTAQGGESGDFKSRICRWLNEKSDPLVFVLGDYGTGRTTFCHVLCAQMSEALADKPSESMIPVFAPFREVERLFDDPDPLRQILY